ncbi:MAG: hypothetical protein ACSHX9_04360 [Luteolibacter sp.]
MTNINFRKHALRLLSLGFTFGMLNSCIVAPDSYQGNGIWARPDGSTYQAPAPVRVRAVESAGRPRIFESVRTIEDKSVNSQGQTVIRQRDESTININFSMYVILENGEEYILNFDANGKNGETRYVSRTFTGRNGYSYTVSGNIRLSRYDSLFNVSISTKGLSTWQGSVVIR